MKQIRIISALCVLTIMSSCGEDFLEPAPTSVISSATYYSNESELQTGVINMYDGIQGVNDDSNNVNHGIQYEFYITEMRSDNTRTKSGQGVSGQFENFTVNTINAIVSDYYASYYNVIFRANTVLENLDVASDGNRARIEAEARFVRAYAYFNLVRLYGDIPLVDRVIGVSDSDISFIRVDKDIIYDFIIDDFQFAIENLENNSVNRASKAAAQTFLAKVYLTQQTNYLLAQQLLEEVMQSGFSLEPNFKDVFYSEDNSEVIFAIGFIPDNANDSQGFSAEFLNAVGETVGVNYLEDDVKNALDALGGNRTMFSYRVDAVQPTQHQVVKYLPNGDASLGIAPTSNNPRLAGNDWIVLRYSDVLLMHVEAIMGTAQETSVPAALDSFQEVRDRAGLTDTVTNITKQELLDERRVELAFENHRLFDLIRFNAAVSTLTAFSNANGYSFSANDLLLPIPQREINLSNGLLTQNPGY